MSHLAVCRLHEHNYQIAVSSRVGSFYRINAKFTFSASFAKVLVQFEVRLSRICGEGSGTGAGFSPKYFGFLLSVSFYQCTIFIYCIEVPATLIKRLTDTKHACNMHNSNVTSVNRSYKDFHPCILTAE